MHCRSTLAAGAAEVYSGGHAEARLIRGALSTPGGVRREGDLIGETGNPREDARARPEGKTAPFTIAGRTGDLLCLRATASW